MIELGRKAGIDEVEKLRASLFEHTVRVAGRAAAVEGRAAAGAVGVEGGEPR